jgi:uncharacterized membrane protein
LSEPFSSFSKSEAPFYTQFFEDNLKLVERPHRDILGSLTGMIVFLGGIALLVFTFKLAYALYTIAPTTALKMNNSKAIDFASTGSHLLSIVIRTILLLIMGFVSSLVAKRGIHLYSHSLVRSAAPPPSDE